MATALILGANGFVGPWLAQELVSHGYDVFASDVQDEPSSRLSCDGYRAADLLDPASIDRILLESQPDQIYDLAAVSSVAQSWRMPALTMRVNVEGTVNLLESCRSLDRSPRLLLVGSSEEYAPSEAALSEESPLAATSPYGISKIAQGNLSRMYAERYGLHVYHVRSFNHTGPWQSDAFVIPSWCRQAALIERSGKPGTIRVGNTRVRRDVSDVRDVVRGYRMLVESDHEGEAFNICSGVSYELASLLDAIVSYTDVDVSVEVDPELLRPSDNPMILGDRSKAERLLGWHPEHGIEETLGAVYRHFLEA